VLSARATALAIRWPASLSMAMAIASPN
jgi:hypothetical protein